MALSPVGKGVHCFNMASEPLPVRAPECIEKVRLLQKYNHDITELDRTTIVLGRKNPPLSQVERERISAFLEILRTRVEAAKGALDAHIAEHGCGQE